jgi:pimeloyl-ACP methyl ester carboxylesterase
MRAVVLADGLRLVVRDQGAGLPVLLLRAWGETRRTFNRLIELLPDGLRILAPDQQGVGESDKPGQGYSLQDAASDVVGLLDALDLRAAWVVGSSSGGYVAQQVATSHPDRLLGLVLVGAPRSLSGADPFSSIIEGFHDPGDSCGSGQPQPAVRSAGHDCARVPRRTGRRRTHDPAPCLARRPRPRGIRQPLPSTVERQIGIAVREWQAYGCHLRLRPIR